MGSQLGRRILALALVGYLVYRIVEVSTHGRWESVTPMRWIRWGVILAGALYTWPWKRTRTDETPS